MSELKNNIKRRLDRIAASGSYTASDLLFFENLYPSGQDDIRNELRCLLDVPSNDEVIHS